MSPLKINSGQHESIFVFDISPSEKEFILEFLRNSEIFFHMRESEKLTYQVSGGAINYRGYFKYKSQNYDIRGEQKDLKEGFDFGRHLLDRDFNHFFGPNLWPPQMDQYAQVFQFFEVQGARFLRFFAGLLGLAQDELTNKFTNPVANLRVLHYPGKDPVNSQQTHLVSHHDPGFATLLYSDQQALEYLCSETGIWMPIVASPNQIIVLLGTTAERWSEGRARSSLHRISQLKGCRTSLCFFYNPDFHAEIISVGGKDRFHAGRFIYCESVEGPELHDSIYRDIITNRLF